MHVFLLMWVCGEEAINFTNKPTLETSLEVPEPLSHSSNALWEVGYDPQYTYHQTEVDHGLIYTHSNFWLNGNID